MKTRNNKPNGFSLIELMIVVAIVAVLVAIALPQFQRFSAKARRAEGIALLKGFHTAELSHFALHDGFTHKNGGTGIPANLGFAPASTPKFYNIDGQPAIPGSQPIFTACGDLICVDNQSFFAMIYGQLDSDDRLDILVIGTVAIPGYYETPDQVMVDLISGNDDVLCPGAGCP